MAARDGTRRIHRAALDEGLVKREPKSAVKWNRLGTGLALAALAGVVFGHAWTTNERTGWWAGLVTLLCATLLILSAIYARQEKLPGIGQPLGHILVTRGWITEAQLGEALARHYRDGRPLGQLLIGMGVITPVQLSRALGEQAPAAADGSNTAQIATIFADSQAESAEVGAAAKD
jgi:hypothetical protein